MSWKQVSSSPWKSPVETLMAIASYSRDLTEKDQCMLSTTYRVLKGRNDYESTLVLLEVHSTALETGITVYKIDNQRNTNGYMFQKMFSIKGFVKNQPDQSRFIILLTDINLSIFSFVFKEQGSQWSPYFSNAEPSDIEAIQRFFQSNSGSQ